MSRLHRAHRPAAIARWLLAWFALTLLVGIAAPVMNPQALAWLCSATNNSVGNTGSSLDPAQAPASDDEGGLLAGLHGGQHCPLCASPAAPPPAPLALGAAAPAGVAQRSAPPADAPPSHRAAPPAARGPPLTFLS